MLILLSRKRRNIIFDIASLRLIKFTSLPGRLKISNTSTGRERISKVRYLELTIHKTPCCLPHRYEPDQTCILPTRKEDTSTGGVHKFGVLSSNIRLLLNRTPLGVEKPNQEIFVEKGRIVRGGRNRYMDETFRYNFDLQTFHAFPR